MIIKPLTSLRFFFALAVFLSHTRFLLDNNKFFGRLIETILSEGYLGVSFFFILSGFILSLNYQTKILSNQTCFTEFWIARLARIYPLHLFTLLISLPLSGIFTINAHWVATFFANLFLLQSFIPIQSIYFSFNAPSWSISDELFFYMLFPYLALFFFKFRRAPLLSLVFLSLIPIGILIAPSNLEHPLFYINPLIRLADFILGILLFRLYSKLRNLNWDQKPSGNLSETFAIALFVLFFTFHEHIPQAFRFSCYYWIPMSVIILAFSFQSGFLSQILSKKVLVVLGEISFSFYLLHQLILRYVTFINDKWSLLESSYGIFMIILAITLTASFLSYKYIELPLNRYIRNKYISSRPSRVIKMGTVE